MKLKKSQSIQCLLASFVIAGVGLTSCKKEIETNQASEEKRGIETWKTLDDYPSEITLDNWEEFVYAPKEVIAHFQEKERLESCASNTIKSNGISTNPGDLTAAPLIGKVRFYQGNVSNPGLVLFPGVTVSNCLHSFLTHNINGAVANYILPSSCTSDPVICMAVDQPIPSPMNWCDFTQQYAGVTSLDLVLIQKHILGLEVFTEPAQFIAADVNRDELISGSDIVEIRKLILGKISGWLNSDNYLFIDDGIYDNFTTLTNLYNNDGQGNATNPCQPETSLHRIGVKTGDVNGSLANCF